MLPDRSAALARCRAHPDAILELIGVEREHLKEQLVSADARRVVELQGAIKHLDALAGELRREPSPPREPGERRNPY